MRAHQDPARTPPCRGLWLFGAPPGDEQSCTAFAIASRPVVTAAGELGASFQCIQKVAEEESNLEGLQFTTDNATLLAEIGSNCHVAAGTAWLWARADAFQLVDVLFIDEAAQMSLANVLAVSQAANSVVLLGDPRQLEQPMQGSHPEGTDVSALTHILGPHATIPADRDCFWRKHGGCTRKSAPSLPNCFMMAACIRDLAWNCNKSSQLAELADPA